MNLFGVEVKGLCDMKPTIYSTLNPRRIHTLLPLLVVLCWTSHQVKCAEWVPKSHLPEEVDKSEKIAIEKYPDLGIANSAFNSTFLSAVKLLKEKRPTFFFDPRWPLKLSDAVAVDLKVAPKVSLSSALHQESAENPEAYEELEQYCAQSVKNALRRKEVTGTSKDWFGAGDQLQAARIADSLTIAALQSEDTFDDILDAFLSNMLSSAALKASPKNEDWIQAVLWRSSSWRCIEKYTDAEQCEIFGRLLAKCGNSKLVTDWILRYKHDINLRDSSILSDSQKSVNRAASYALREGICERILSSNYYLGQLSIDKADVLCSGSEMKIWKIFNYIPSSEWGLLRGWELMEQLPSSPPSDDQSEWCETLNHLESSIEARVIQVRKFQDRRAPPPRDTFGCFESYLVCSFSEFNGTPEGFEWIDSIYRRTSLSPDPTIRKATRFVTGFKVAALMWASKQK